MFLRRFFLLCFVCFIPFPIFAIGTYAEGWVVTRILQFESRGILFTSYEGTMEINDFDAKEVCLEEKDECFRPTKKVIPFSVRPDNGELVNLLSKSVNQEVLVKYRVHRIAPLTLSTDNELLQGQNQIAAIPEGQGERLVVKRTGSKRNFSVSGRVLQLDYQGTLVGTYEGLYLDEERGKVHAFSVTNPEMASYAWNAMRGKNKYFLGISVAFATGFRKSDYDLFEINYKVPAGGVYPPKEK